MAIKALMKPALLEWARTHAKVSAEDAKRAAHVTADWPYGLGERRGR
jgi:hypothetical protein